LSFSLAPPDCVLAFFKALAVNTFFLAISTNSRQKIWSTFGQTRNIVKLTAKVGEVKIIEPVESARKRKRLEHAGKQNHEVWRGQEK